MTTTKSSDELISILSRHTDEDLADVLHTLIEQNRSDSTVLSRITDALYATKVLRNDGTESPTI